MRDATSWIRITLLVLLMSLPVFIGYKPVFAASMITEIRIEGNERVDRTSIERSLAFKVGDPLENSLVTRSVKDLYRLGVFSRVAIETEDAEEGIVLIVRVSEFPMIRKIVISGNKAIQEQELKKGLTMKTFSFFDPAKLGGEIESINAVYRSAGYHDTVVTHAIEESEKGVNLTYMVKESEKAPVLEIDIIGNRALGDSEIVRVMGLKEKGPLSFISGGGGYDESLVAEDVKRIQYLYMEKGYLDIAVEDPQVEIHPHGQGMYVSIQVREGPKYVLGETVFSGDWDEPPDFTRSDPEVGIGDVFARSKVLNDIRMYEDSYRDQGYAWVRIEPRFARNVQAGTISLDMVLQRGPLVHIRWINISGNFKTREYVIRREMRLMEGELFSQKKLDDSQKFIRALGFFESVDIRLNDAGGGFTDINIRVKEGTAGSLSAGVAFSSVSGLVGTLKLSLGNFSGRGQRLNLNIEMGSETSTYSISFTEPRLFSSNYSFGLDLFDKVNEYSTYTQNSIGAAVRLGYRISDVTSISMRYRYVEYDIYDIALDASGIILEQEGKSATSSVRLGYRYDTRDFPMDPRDGEDFRLYGELAGGALGGTNDFLRFLVEGSLFRPIIGDLIGLAHAEAGIINSYDGNEIPVTERFFMGGLYTLRGFEYRKVGPLEDDEPVGGAKSLLFNLEATYPLIRDANIKGVLFLDAGNVWADGEKMALGELRYGAGFGFRWAAPIGLLRLEWGFNMDPRPDEDQPGWEFSIGALF